MKCAQVDVTDLIKITVYALHTIGWKCSKGQFYYLLKS